MANKELWQEMLRLVQLKQKDSKINWHYVRGHQGTPGNERVDSIADNFAQGVPENLYQGSLLKYDHAIYDIPEDTSLPTRKTSSSKTKKKAYS